MDQNLNQNEYFQKKEAKEKEAQKAAQRAKFNRLSHKLPWLVAAIIIVWVVVRLSKDDGAPVHVGEYFQAQSREHIEVGTTHPAYNSNPPTGGWHYASPAKTGIYDVELPDEQLIHNLEHSHIWIAYRPDLSVKQVEMLAEVAKDYGSRVIMTPRKANDALIALVAWEHLLKMDTVDKAMVDSFVKAHRNKAGPEKNIPDFDFKDWRTKK